jgi:hypothetical protein
VRKVSKRQFARNDWMGENHTVFQFVDQRIVTFLQVIHPYRGVRQDHAVVLRLRRATLSSGSLPPSAASLRALSRSINAFIPSG